MNYFTEVVEQDRPIHTCILMLLYSQADAPSLNFDNERPPNAVSQIADIQYTLYKFMSLLIVIVLYKNQAGQGLHLFLHVDG